MTCSSNWELPGAVMPKLKMKRGETSAQRGNELVKKGYGAPPKITLQNWNKISGTFTHKTFIVDFVILTWSKHMRNIGCYWEG